MIKQRSSTLRKLQRRTCSRSSFQRSHENASHALHVKPLMQCCLRWYKHGYFIYMHDTWASIMMRTMVAVAVVDWWVSLWVAESDCSVQTDVKLEKKKSWPNFPKEEDTVHARPSCLLWAINCWSNFRDSNVMHCYSSRKTFKLLLPPSENRWIANYRSTL